VGFVSQQISCLLRVKGADKLRGNVDDIRGNPYGIGQHLVYLVPGKELVRGDVKVLPYGLGVAHEPKESLGKILCVGDGP